MSVNARELFIKNKAIGADPTVDKILTEGTPEAALYAQALALKKRPLKKMYIEACLLASQDFPRIAEILELNIDVLTMYCYIFYDTVGLDKLSKMELLEVSDRQEKLLKLWALHQGLDFLAWRLGMKTEISPIEGLQELFSTAMYKAKEACFSGNATEESKAAAAWTKLSMDLARLLKAYTTDGDMAKKDLQIALKDVVPDFAGFPETD
jgi:hypothetical protein